MKTKTNPDTQYAIDLDTGKPIPISEAKQDGNYRCINPNCDCKGVHPHSLDSNLRKASFTHAYKGQSSYGETPMHIKAKIMLSDISYFNNKIFKTKEGLILNDYLNQYEKSLIEDKFNLKDGRYRIPDVTMVSNGLKSLAVEIYHSSQVDDYKRNDFINNDLNYIEINALDYDKDIIIVESYYIKEFEIEIQLDKFNNFLNDNNIISACNCLDELKKLEYIFYEAIEARYKSAINNIQEVIKFTNNDLEFKNYILSKNINTSFLIIYKDMIINKLTGEILYKKEYQHPKKEELCLI